jgi:hypothetical protein
VISNVCLFSVLCVVITCVLMTYVEHDPMQEILAKPLYVTSFELVLEFRPSEPALRVTQSEVVSEFRRSEPALRVTWPSFGNTTVYDSQSIEIQKSNRAMMILNHWLPD